MHTPIIIQTETNPFRAVYAYVRPAIGNIRVMYYIITLIQLYMMIYLCIFYLIYYNLRTFQQKKYSRNLIKTLFMQNHVTLKLEDISNVYTYIISKQLFGAAF